MTQLEHLEWAKGRALEIADTGDPNEAVRSMVTDLRAHPELKNHAGIQPWFVLAVLRDGSTRHDVKRWIEGFH